MKKLALLTATALLAAGPALAQTQTQTTQQRTTTQPMGAHPGTTTTTTTTRAEVVNAPEFARMAAISDMFEIQSSQMAEQRSQNPQVKQFAQRMVTDHTKTTNEMKQLMQQAGSGPLHNMQMPSGLDQKHQALLTQLQQAQGPQFDQMYIQQQVQAHQMAVDMFQNYARSGDNAQLKQFASQTLPALQQHLQMAQELQRSMRG